MKKFLLPLVLAFGMVAFAQQDVTVTWLTGNTGQAIEYANAASQRYMDANPHTIGGEDYNVTVNVLQGPESATDRYAQYLQYFQAQSGEADLLEIDVIWPGDLAEHLVDLYQYEGMQEAVADMFPAIVENNTVDGALVGIPAFTDAGLLYYRSDLIEKYGFSGPPATWAEMAEMAQTIQDGERGEGNQDFYGFVWQGAAYEGLTCDALEWVASNDGGTIISPDGTITINNENAIDIVQQAADWVGTISPSGVTGFQEEDARRIWTAGNAAFMRNWPYAYSLSVGEESAITIDQFGVMPLPAGSVEGGSPAATLGGWQYGVSQYSANPAAAADFAMFLASYDEQLTRAINLSNLPTIQGIYNDEQLLNSDVAWFNALLPVFQNAVARPSTATAPNYNEVSRAFYTTVHDVLTGSANAEDAFAELELDLEDLTGLPTGTP